jgi:hypothetical protein
VHAVNASVLWIAGDGFVLKSTDGGQSWLEIYVDDSASLNTCYFLDEHRGFVGGADWGYSVGASTGRIYFREFVPDALAPSMAFSGAAAAPARAIRSVTGTAQDDPAGTGIHQVAVSLRRSADGLYWADGAWTGTPQPLFVESGVDATGKTIWRVRTPLPSGALLPTGAYELRGLVHDNAGNAKSVSRAVTIDATPPTVTTTAPRAYSRSLTAISGMAADLGGSGLKRVLVALRRKIDLKYWSGAAWQTAAAYLPTVGGATWHVDPSLLPGDPALLEGSYYLYQRAYDYAGNVGARTTLFQLDRTRPGAVKISSPVAGAVVGTLSSVSGTAADNPGGSGIDHVSIRLLRLSDGLWWNGAGWGTSAVLLPASGTTVWTKTAGLPAGADLPSGGYKIQAFAYDRAGLNAGTSVTFTKP